MSSSDPPSNPPTGGPPDQQGPPPGPPYLPSAAVLGGRPTPQLDDPICAVFLLLFMIAGAVHMGIFRRNIKRDHKFVFSALLFMFCFARICALTMRIVWASIPGNLNAAVASNILVAAGVVLLFLVNLIFTQRIVRSYHPKFGWHKATGWAFIAAYTLVVALLIMLIVATVHSFFTLDPAVRAQDRVVQLFGSTMLAFLAFAPFPIVVLAIMWPYRESAPEKFGYGSLRAQTFLVMSTSLLLTLGAGFRTGVAYDARPVSQPAWFTNKPCYYIFNYGVEVIVVTIYAAARVDRRFWVGDGCSAPGDYSASRRTSMLPAFEAQSRRESTMMGLPPNRATMRTPVFTEVLDESGTAVDTEGATLGGGSVTDSRYLATPSPAHQDREKKNWENRARDELERRVSELEKRLSVQGAGSRAGTPHPRVSPPT